MILSRLLRASSSSSSSLALLLVLRVGILSTVVSAGGHESVVLDLSVDLNETLDNPGFAEMESISKARSKLLNGLVVDHGEVVFRYYANDYDHEDGDERHVFSHTKAWTGLLTGMVVDEGLLSLDETLADVFPNETLWQYVPDADARRNVTIARLLSMTSGLYAFDEDVAVSSLYDGNPGGHNLTSALASNRWNDTYVGEYNYLMVCNVLSYVIKERTGTTPREYAAANLFPALGIDDADVKWFVNDDGVQSSYHGLELLPEHMAKFGMLFLQRGLAGPDKRVVSADWIERSLEPQDLKNYAMSDIAMPTTSLWWLKFKEGFYCSMGAFGMQVCVDDETQRVSVKQENIYDYFFSTDLLLNLENIATGFYLDYHYYAFNATFRNETASPSVAESRGPSAGPTGAPTTAPTTAPTPGATKSFPPTTAPTPGATKSFPPTTAAKKNETEDDTDAVTSGSSSQASFSTTTKTLMASAAAVLSAHVVLGPWY